MYRNLLISLTIGAFLLFACSDGQSGSDDDAQDAGEDNACAGLSCWSPPDQVCADSTAVTVFSPNGYCVDGECRYGEKRSECASANCKNGACENTPCQGVTCNHPSSSKCSGLKGVVMFAQDGFCSNGECFYADRETECSSGTCRDGVCGHFTCHGIYCDKSEARYCKNEDVLQIFAPRGLCSSATGEAVCSYADREIACENGCEDGACIENSCKGVTCVVPEARYCEGDDLIAWEYRGRCSEGQCKYTQKRIPCEFGCDEDGCKENPCIGVTCMNPYASYCEDETTLRYFLPDGVCDDGVCVYEEATVECEHGCEDGACIDDPCAGVVCNLPPANSCADDSSLTIWNGEPGECIEGFCLYETEEATCKNGCEDGLCKGEPCIGVVCDLPAADYCLDDRTMYRYAADMGECVDGVCHYLATEERCERGCDDGQCLPLNETKCEDDTCNGHGECDDSDDKVVCSCTAGWKGARCATDINECEIAPSVCDKTAECINEEGSYRCECDDDYEMNDDGVCTPVSEICNPNPCENGGVCIEADAGFACDCPDGFRGERCEIKKSSGCIDNDDDGYGIDCELGEDCDDDDDSAYRWVTVNIDADLDEIGGEAQEEICAGDTLPLGYAETNTDCNDGNGDVWQLLTGYEDNDEDGFGSGAKMVVCAGDTLSLGYSEVDGDCMPEDKTVYPGREEVFCNDKDDDCDPNSEDTPEDGDGDNVTVCDNDCDDSDPEVNPNVEEIYCNDKDDDCDPSTPDSPDIDEDGDTYKKCDDCNDNDAAVHPDAEEIHCNDVDDDCNPSTADAPEIDEDNDNHLKCEDCDDEKGDVWQMVAVYEDNDRDTYGAGSGEERCLGDTVPEGLSLKGGDCNDNEASINPGATEETCNDRDDDCNPETADDPNDDGDSLSLCQGDCDNDDGTKWRMLEGYPDDDGDTYGKDTAEQICGGETLPDGYADRSGDCNDGESSVHPNAEEIPCDDLDNDCAPTTSDTPDNDNDTYSACNDCNDNDNTVWRLMPGHEDSDGDTYGKTDSQQVCGGSVLPSGYVDRGGDCNDTRADINPDATEVPCNDVDEDCNDETSDTPDNDNDNHSVCTDCDDNDNTVWQLLTVYRDSDGDTYGDSESQEQCSGDDAPAGWSLRGGDCNDGRADINPDAAEITCNNIDEDCNDATADKPDNDGDNHSVCTDCNDNNRGIWQMLTVYRDSDNDTYGDGESQERCSGDTPADGWSLRDGDCNDDEASVNPGQSEEHCNDIDDDCNTETPDDVNNDGDPVSLCDGDCDNNNGATWRNTVIYLDNDSDGFGDIEDEGETRCIGAFVPQGYSDWLGDCDDENRDVNPNRDEIHCNDLDDDCNDETSDDGYVADDPMNCGGCDQVCATDGTLWPGGAVPLHVLTFGCEEGTCVIAECEERYRDDPDTPEADCDLDRSTVPGEIIITPSAWGLAVSSNTSVQYTADCIAEYGGDNWDCTTEVTWRVSDGNVASVDEEGLATSVANGTTAVRADAANATVVPATLTVSSFTDWLDRDDGGDVGGDYENISQLLPCGKTDDDEPVRPLYIECQTVDGVDWRQTGDVYTCDTSYGGRCVAEEQPDKDCFDYRVRFICPAV